MYRSIRCDSCKTNIDKTKNSHYEFVKINKNLCSDCHRLVSLRLNKEQVKIMIILRNQNLSKNQIKLATGMNLRKLESSLYKLKKNDLIRYDRSINQWQIIKELPKPQIKELEH